MLGSISSPSVPHVPLMCEPVCIIFVAYMCNVLVHDSIGVIFQNNFVCTLNQYLLTHTKNKIILRIFLCLYLSPHYLSHL